MKRAPSARERCGSSPRPKVCVPVSPTRSSRGTPPRPAVRQVMNVVRQAGRSVRLGERLMGIGYRRTDISSTGMASGGLGPARWSKTEVS